MATENVTVSLEVIDKASKALDDVSKSLRSLEDQTKKTGSSFTQIGNIFSGVFLERALEKGIELIADAAHRLFEIFIVEGIQAAEKQQDALNQLSTAFALAGKNAKDSTASFAAFAEQIQATTKFSNDAVINAGALLESLARLDADGLKRGTQAALNLSAALNIDLDSAVRLVGKAAEGNISTFQRYGIRISEGATQAETFANTLKVLESRFSGAAQAQVNTYSGSITKLGNNFEDAQKAIGDVFVGNQALIAVFNEVGNILIKVTEFLKEHSTEYKHLVAEGITIAIDTVLAFTKAVGFLSPVLATIGRGIAQVVDSLVTLASVERDIINGKFNEALKDTADFFGRANERASKFGQGFSVEPVVNELTKMQGVVAKGTEQIDSGFKTAGESISQASSNVRDFTKEEIAAADAGQKLVEKLQEQDKGFQTLKNINNIQLAVDTGKVGSGAGADAIKAELETQNAIQAEELLKRNDELSKINSDSAQAEIDANNAKLATIFTDAQQASIEKNALLQADSDADLALSNNTAEQKILLNKTTNEKLLKAERDYRNAQSVLQTKQEQTVADSFGNLAGLTRSGNKELFEIGKAAAIAQATIQTHLAITKALAEGGPFLGPVLAITLGIKGAVEIASIAAQTLATGITTVPGPGTKDSVPALLTPGERVLSRDQNSDLTRFLAQQEANRDLLSIIAAGVNRDNSVSVSVDGNVLFESVNNRLKSGRRFAS